MSLRPSHPGQPAPDPSSDSGRLLDLLHGGLSAAEERALREGLSAQPALAAELAALERLAARSRAALSEPTDAVLARRIALRVRDQVRHEETAHEREQTRPAGRWSSRTFARVLLASLAVHVALLGWLLLREPSSTPLADRGSVGVAVHTPERREPALLEELAAPPELGPIVAAEMVPDAWLERRGLEPAEDAGAVEREAIEPPMRVAEHPWPVQYDMLARSRAGVKRGRLLRAGVDAGVALARVDAGLQALASRQLADGSWPRDVTVPEAERAPYGPMGLTGLALLPFLGEGRRSVAGSGGAADPVVARGVAWLRAAASGGAGTPDRPVDLALGLLALSEDYMLCYGRFEPATATRRAGELVDLAARLARHQTAEGSFPGEGDTRLWPLLALDAMVHTGVVSSAGQSLARLARWFDGLPRSPEGVPLGADSRPDAALAAGRLVAVRGLGVTADGSGSGSAGVLATTATEVSPTSLAAGMALYRGDAAAFGAWNRAQAASQVARLGPGGVVLRGDPVADTALVLLVLQSAYRAY